MAIIKITDEVNCKIEGLELSTKQKLVKTFKYEIPYARHTPAYKLGRWDGKKGFFSLSGNTFINLLDEILPIIVDEGYDVELEDSRDYKTVFEFSKIDKSLFSHIKWPKGHRLADEPIVLNDHQVDAINGYLEHPQSIRTIATGGGKTIITGAMSYLVEPYGRSIVIVPSKSLVTQTEDDYKNLGLDVGVYYGSRKEWNKTHTICTWQSLNQLYKDSKNGVSELTLRDFVDGVICVIVDECHTVKASALEGMLGGPFAKVPIRWGLTGTIPKEKFEAISLETMIGKVKGEITAAELQQKGILANCHIHIKQLQDNRDLGNYQSELKWLLGDSDRLDHLSGMIIDIAKTGNTLVLVDRIATINDLALRIGTFVPVATVTGSVKEKDRKKEYNSVRDADDKIIIASYGVASTGISIDRIFNLILIEPGKSFVRVIQSIGRSLRLGSDKEFANVYDITSNCKFSKRHLTKRKQYYAEAEYKFTVDKVKWQ